jgi:hypothetical protein
MTTPFRWKEDNTVDIPDGDHGYRRFFTAAAKQTQGAVNDLQTAERFLEQNSPEYLEMMKKLYPRIYQDTGRYHSPKLCAAAMAMAVHEVQRVGLHRAPTAYRLMMLGMAELIEHKVPMFFIAPDLLEAIMRTDFRDDINWLDMHLPYATGIFMLPKGTLPHPTDGDTSMILWARNRKGPMRAPFPGVPAPGIGNTAFVLLALCPERVIWIDSTLSEEVRPTMRLNNLFYRKPGDPIPKGEKSSWMDQDLAEEDSAYVEKIGVIAFGTLMAMNARPELVEQSRLIRRVAKADKVREFWSPNIIGGKYKAKREVPRITSEGTFAFDQTQPGTHAAPLMHWRRGHFRMHAYGAGYKLHKQLWIEPVLVNAS